VETKIDLASKNKKRKPPLAKGSPESMIQISKGNSVLEFYPISFPTENPETALDDITDALEYIGAFKNIQKPTHA